MRHILINIKIKTEAKVVRFFGQTASPHRGKSSLLHQTMGNSNVWLTSHSYRERFQNSVSAESLPNLSHSYNNQWRRQGFQTGGAFHLMEDSRGGAREKTIFPGLAPVKILKYRISEMLFPAFWDDILKNSEVMKRHFKQSKDSIIISNIWIHPIYLFHGIFLIK